MTRIPRGLKQRQLVSIPAPIVSVKDYGGHARFYVNGEEYGYINYDTKYSSDFAFLDMPPDSIYLRWMAVKYGKRRSGIGSAAYREFESILKSKGIRHVFLHPKDSKAKSFWEKQGFFVVLTHPKTIMKKVL